MEALIELLPKTDGEVRGDIRRHLFAVAGQVAGADDRAWSSGGRSTRRISGFRPPVMSRSAPKRCPARRRTMGCRSMRGGSSS